MAAIVLQVDEIVEDVNARCAERESQKRQKRLSERLRGEDVRCQKGHEHESVLGVLMHPQELRPSAPGGALVLQMLHIEAGAREAARDARSRADGDGLGG